jgi:hypothetical protein
MKLLLLICAFAAQFNNGRTSEATKIKASVVVSEKDPQKVTLSISNPANERLMLIVSHVTNGQVYMKDISGLEYKTSLNFEGAEDGEYTIEVMGKKTERIRKKIRIQSEQIITRTVTVD